MGRGRAASYDDQREMILARAAEQFAIRGYPGTSVSQIAEAAGLSKATLYYYCRDKHRLLVEIAEGHVSRLVATVEAVQALGLPPRVRLQELVERVLREYAQAQHAHHVLTGEVRYMEPADRERILDMQRRVIAGFAAAIAEWRPEQDTARLVKPLTMLLFGMINWMFTWHKPNGELSFEAMATIVSDLVMTGVPGVRPRAGTDTAGPDRTISRSRSVRVAAAYRPAEEKA